MQQVKFTFLFLAIFSLILTVSCSKPTFIDKSSMESQELQLENGDYFDIAWILPNMIVFTYAPSEQPNFSEHRPIVYDLESRERLYELAVPAMECNTIWQDTVARTLDGNLALLSNCIYPSGEYNFSLWTWSSTSEIWQEEWQYPVAFFARSITFTPNISAWIQEDDASGGLTPRLVYVDKATEQEVPILGELKKNTQCNLFT